ncbi:MAG: diaminopimelate epimerase [bacterium]
MAWRLPFVKMHGAGNDFIMVAGCDLRSSGLSGPTIQKLCHRRVGIGADGLIIVREQSDVDFSMTYYNADGGEAEMCGNGARCCVAFAHTRGLAADSCRFETGAGRVAGVIDSSGITVSLPAWRELRLDVDFDGSPFPAHHTVNTGVPHIVVPLDEVESVDVAQWGAFLRFQDRLASSGANVNFVAAAGDAGFRLRTYERGVEAETLACGTGAAATAVVLCALNLATSPVTLKTRGGDTLTVSVGHEADPHALRLHGPAVVAFTGEVEINE